MTEAATDRTAPTEPAPSPPSEQELRAAYEAELSRITSADLILQTAASLLNLGARRLGLTGAPAGAEAPRDLEQVRDAIDGVRALMPILERRFEQAGESAPLRDALSQLQMAYAREMQRGGGEQTPAGEPAAATASPQAGADAPGPGTETQQPGQSRPPGPAEASGRLWVPGR